MQGIYGLVMYMCVYLMPVIRKNVVSLILCVLVFHIKYMVQ